MMRSGLWRRNAYAHSRRPQRIRGKGGVNEQGGWKVRRTIWPPIRSVGKRREARNVRKRVHPFLLDTYAVPVPCSLSSSHPTLLHYPCPTASPSSPPVSYPSPIPSPVEASPPSVQPLPARRHWEAMAVSLRRPRPTLAPPRSADEIAPVSFFPPVDALAGLKRVTRLCLRVQALRAAPSGDDDAFVSRSGRGMAANVGMFSVQPTRKRQSVLARNNREMAAL